MYIAFLNPQGNFDKSDSRWASHPDFGGQLVYVKELASAMAKMGHRVDILTRQIIDGDWKEFSQAFDAYEGIDNLRIVRLKFGPDRFLNKEELWPHIIPGYVNEIIKFYQKQGEMPDAFTSHYGDGGLAAAYLKQKTGIPFTFTAHSLGAQKMDKLRVNKNNIKEMDEKYNFTLRLLAERTSINKADRIVTSTLQERFNQYTHTAYQEAVVIDNNEKFAVIPPGVSLEVFDRKIKADRETTDFIEKVLNRDIDSDRIELPAIISSSRLDPKKNISGIIKAYGESETLQEKSNLVIVTKGYQNPLADYKKLPKTSEKKVLLDLISLIDQYSLRGKVSMISIEKQQNLAHMYRLFAKRQSVFCLAALYEPFGLAPLEAIASGLPVVVTKFGGPAESLREGDQEFGLLVDPTNTDELAGALYSLINSKPAWESFVERGYRRILDKYTWSKTAFSYIENINEVLGKKKEISIFDIPINPYFISPDEELKPGVQVLEDLYLRMDILCVGETVIDFISKKKTNSLIDAEDFSRYPGGNPAYVSVYTSKMSKKAALITKLGRGHFSTYMENELRKYGVNTEYIKYTNSYDTSVAFLSHTPTEPDIQSMHSADWKLSIKDISYELIERSDMIYTSHSSMVEEPARSAIRKALRIAKKEKKKTALDPNFHPHMWEDVDEGLEVLAQVCDGITIVKPYLSDARHIFGYNMLEKDLTELCIKNFHDWGARIVVLTAGGRYVIVSDSEGKTVRTDSLPPVNILDATGGGRAFMSGFLVAYQDGLKLEKCIYFGHEVASIALQSIGPFPKSIHRNEIENKIESFLQKDKRSKFK
ncbi:MAG: PfkB family carbohydrate kinase [Elusimicrobiota bacterium]